MTKKHVHCRGGTDDLAYGLVAQLGEETKRVGKLTEFYWSESIKEWPKGDYGKKRICRHQIQDMAEGVGSES